MAVTVYTKDNCVQCEATKRHLDKLEIPYSTVNITNDIRALDKLISLGYRSAPVVVTDDDSWAGYVPDKLDKLAI
jgi:glutaredoxin-like protein NrdH